MTRSLLAAYLERAGHRVSAVEDGAQLDAVLPADLVIMDLELPGEHGFVLTRKLRASSTIPIIIVTRRAAAGDRVLGLELGADDYVVKPPEMDELLARVKNLLWRTRSSTPTPTTTDGEMRRFGEWALDRTRQSLVSRDEQAVPLTLAELQVLSALLDARGTIVPRSALIEALGGGSEDRSRSLDVIMNRLRRKLGEGGPVVPRIILTVHGVGYRLGVSVS